MKRRNISWTLIGNQVPPIQEGIFFRWYVWMLFVLGLGVFVTSVWLTPLCRRTIEDTPCSIRAWKAHSMNPSPIECQLPEEEIQNISNYLSYNNELLFQSEFCTESIYSQGYCESSYEDICNEDHACLVTKHFLPCANSSVVNEYCLSCHQQEHFSVQGTEKCTDFFCYGTGQHYEVVHTNSLCSCPTFCEPLHLGCPSDNTRASIDGLTRGMKTPLAFVGLFILSFGYSLRSPGSWNPLFIVQRVLQWYTIFISMVFIIEMVFGYCSTEKQTKQPSMDVFTEIEARNWFEIEMMFPDAKDDRDDPLICPTGATYLFISAIIIGVIQWFLPII